MRRALVTGITGQDGSYLAELLLDKGYEVHGLVRRSSSFNTERIDRIAVAPHERDDCTSGPRVVLHHGDMTDGIHLVNLVRDIAPHEVYNLAAMSHVQVSFEVPEYVASTNAVGTVRLLDAIRSAGLDCRFYQASTSEMFGSTPPPQHEESGFHPRSPYGVSKLFAHWATVNYREAYDMYAVSGILFNHESPRRGLSFVTRKITSAVARIAAGKQKELFLGNLDAIRDWGYAREYVEGMWQMLQHDEPTDFVLATGVGTTVRELCEAAFAHAGLDWADHVRYDPAFERPAEVNALIGDAGKARDLLGWTPRTSALELAWLMVDADIELLADGHR
ncbi:MAG: GDP-mannose 4,6-dehydratase [Marmoricola sp.]